MIIKIIRNVSGETRQILNRDIANQDSYDIQSNLWFELFNSDEIAEGILARQYIVNDGSRDLSVSEGLEHLNKFQQETSNFSYHSILDGESIIIPERQHMYTSDIDIEGSLEVAGRLILIEE